MKKLIGAIVLSLALLMSTGCTVSVNLGGNTSNENGSDSINQGSSTQQGSDNDNQSGGADPDSSNGQGNNSQNNGASENPSQDGSENENAIELMNAPTVSYCNINGSGLTEGYFVYTSDDTYGEMFTFVTAASDSSYAMIIAALIPPSQCKEGLVLKGSELTSNAQLYYLYVDGYSLSTYELLSSQSTASFSNMEFCLYSYEASGSAVYSIKADITDENGKTMNVDLGGGGAYTDPSQFQQIQNGSSTGSDGSCWACHGSKICPVCFGKRKYYVPGYGVTAGTYVNCAGCNGNGICSYCA